MGSPQGLWPGMPQLLLALEVGGGDSTDGPEHRVELAPAPGLHLKAEPVPPSSEIISTS